MDKKKAIVNTLLGKLQARSKAIFEEVSDEVWDFGQEKPAEKDYELELDGEEIEKQEEDEEKVSALDAILDSPVDVTEKDVVEY